MLVRYVSLVLVMGFLLGGCAGPEAAVTPTIGVTVTPSFERSEMLRSLVDEVILPTHLLFLNEAAELEAAAVAFQGSPDAAHLGELRAAWHETSMAWIPCTIFFIGAIDTERLHSGIDQRPVRSEFVEEVIAGEQLIDVPYIESIGSTSKGLPAIEYFIFDPEKGDEEILAALQEERRMAYLVATAVALRRSAEVLWERWSPEGGDYAAAFVAADGDGQDFDSSVNLLLNRIFAVSEDIVVSRLGEPLGDRHFEEPQPQLVDAPLSRSSSDRVLAELRGLYLTFTGGNGVGFDDYLDGHEIEYEGEPLSAVINAQFEMTIAAVEALEAPLYVAVETETTAVRAAWEEARKLLILLRVPMANQLGVSLTFYDGDGD